MWKLRLRKDKYYAQGKETKTNKKQQQNSSMAKLEIQTTVLKIDV